jgi:hypothetical protein
LAGVSAGSGFGFGMGTSSPAADDSTTVIISAAEKSGSALARGFSRNEWLGGAMVPVERLLMRVSC